VRNLPSRFIIAAIVFLAFLMGRCWAGDEKSSSGGVEIFVQGRKYKSIREYKREQIKAAFTDVLSTKDLREFTEDELTAIIKEICHESGQAGSGKSETGFSVQEGAETGAIGENASRTQKELKDYLKEYEVFDPSLVDPQNIEATATEHDSSWPDASGD